MSKFRIGDRVIVPANTDPGLSDICWVLGMVGTIKWDDGGVGRPMYSVEFDEPITKGGYAPTFGTCNGRCKEGHGWYCHERFLALYEPEPTPEMLAWMAYDQEES